MAREFVHSIREMRTPISGGYSGYRVVRLLEAAQQSMQQNGRPIELRVPEIPHPNPILPVTKIIPKNKERTWGNIAGSLPT
jgi:hypothetical protein